MAWFARAAAAVAVVGDETESMVEGTVAAIIRMCADTDGEAPEFFGEAAVGLIAGVAEGTQGDFGGQHLLACLLGQCGFRGEVGGFHSGEGDLRSLGGPTSKWWHRCQREPMWKREVTHETTQDSADKGAGSGCPRTSC